MSLTGLLRESGSPLRAAFRQWLPNTPRFVSALNKEASASPCVTGKPIDAGLSGTAIDYRLRYYFGLQPLADTAAWHGALRLMLALKELGLEMEFLDTFRQIERSIEGWQPVGRALPDPEEQEFSRYCVVLAYFEQFYRAGFSLILDGSQAGTIRGAADVLALPRAEVIADVANMSRAFFEAQYPLLQSRAVMLNPTFEGSADVGGADADIIADGSLIEFKSSAQDRPLSGEDVYQLLAYPCLDYHDEYGIHRVGISLVRRNLLTEWDLVSLVADLSRGELTYLDLRTLVRGFIIDLRAAREQGAV